MAYSEVVKNFNRIREDMREFYVYGFKSREEYTKKSGRSYDDERRRLESWLGDYMQFRQTPEKKTVFLSIDSRLTKHNPLYQAWKAKSFTDGDITLHFLLMDLLSEPDSSMTLTEITEGVDEMLSDYEEPRTFDESTIRKKLKEYEKEGIIRTEKKGRTVYYRRSPMSESEGRDVLNFFSETAPCGVIGSFLLDKNIGKTCDQEFDNFAFKHHYITSTLDSEILCSLFQAMGEKRRVVIGQSNRKSEKVRKAEVLPLQIMISVQNGRQHLMAYLPGRDRILALRLDHILSVEPGEVDPEFDTKMADFRSMQSHLWGVSADGTTGERMEHVDFTVRYGKFEEYIHGRLLREKRCGTVEKLDEFHSRFSADVFDVREMFPWIRSFLCRITEINFSDERLKKQFMKDLSEMYRMYGIENEVNAPEAGEQDKKKTESVTADEFGVADGGKDNALQ